jgi:hypothetical protein
MNLRTTIVGTLAVAAAFGGAHAMAHSSGGATIAYAQRAEVITVTGALPAIPSLGPQRALPALAKRHRRIHPAPRPLDPVVEPPPAPRPDNPRPPVIPRPQPTPQPDHSGGGDVHSEPVPPAPTAVPTPAPVEPDPGDQTDEDPNAEAPE